MNSIEMLGLRTDTTEWEVWWYTYPSDEHPYGVAHYNKGSWYFFKIHVLVKAYR